MNANTKQCPFTEHELRQLYWGEERDLAFIRDLWEKTNGIRVDSQTVANNFKRLGIPRRDNRAMHYVRPVVRYGPQVLTSYTMWRVSGEPFAEPSSNGHSKWYVECRCECGTYRDVFIHHLKSGYSKSCGCAPRQKVAARATKHGCSKSGRLYSLWVGINGRCNNPNNVGFHHYGGRGIHRCAEWNDFAVFRNWAIASSYADNLEIDRVDVNGHYEPSNCRWVPRLVNARNKTNTVYLVIFGETKCEGEWMTDARCQVKLMTFRSRYKDLGWSLERALTEPSKGRGANLKNRS